MSNMYHTEDEEIVYFATIMAEEAIKLLKAKGKKRSADYNRRLVTQFITHMINSTIAETMETAATTRATKEVDRYTNVAKEFASLKNDIQNSVADGFSKALTNFTGKTVEYYSLIKIVPTMTSKEFS